MRRKGKPFLCPGRTLFPPVTLRYELDPASCLCFPRLSVAALVDGKPAHRSDDANSAHPGAIFGPGMRDPVAMTNLAMRSSSCRTWAGKDHRWTLNVEHSHRRPPRGRVQVAQSLQRSRPPGSVRPRSIRN